MKWYKHLSDSLNDPDISEIMDKFGSDGYVAFFGILEIMTRNFNQNDGESYTISVKYLRKSLRVSEQKLRNILTFPKFFKRISSEFSNGSVTLKCPKLLDMLETYDRQAKYREQAKLRNDYVTVTKKLHTEEEVEEEGEEEVDSKEYKERVKWFTEIWERYPNKDGKKAAERHFMASVLTQQDFTDINTALDNYLASEKVAEGFIKNGSTWFNNWKDWVNFAGIVKKQDSRLVHNLQAGQKFIERGEK